MNWFNFSGNKYIYTFFGPFHLLYLIFFVGIVILTFKYRDFLKKSIVREYIRWGVVGLLGLLYITFYVWYGVNEGGADAFIENGLPLHWCGVIGYLSMILLITKSKSMFGVMFYWGVTAPIIGLILPGFGEQYGADHFRYHQYFLIHGFMCYAVFFTMYVYDYRPTKRDIYKAFYALVIMTVVVYVINVNLGTNYLYLVYIPEEYMVFSFMQYPAHIPILFFIMYSFFNIEYAIMKNRQRTTILYG